MPLLSATRVAAGDAPIIDVDVHAHPPSIEALSPYLDDAWLEFIRERSWHGTGTADLVYPTGFDATVRPEWRPRDGSKPFADAGTIRHHVLDPLDAEFAILNCYTGIDALRHPGCAAAYVRAVNDWLVAEWLEADPRLRASLIVPARDPDAMVAEIRRVGGHPGFVQVLMPVRSDRLYGNRTWYPVYEAMQEHGLVMGLHRGGTTEGAPSPSGWPSWYVEEYVAEQQVYAAQITSLLSEGVFQSFPSLRVALLEMGFTWLPNWWWRMDADWKGLRREIPWVREPPSQILRERTRVSTAPSDAGAPEELARVIEWLESEDILMFATDYPHMHDEDVGALVGAMPASMRTKVFAESAREWYSL